MSTSGSGLWTIAAVVALVGVAWFIAYCAKTIERGGARLDEQYRRETAEYMVRRERRLRELGMWPDAD